MYNMLEREKYLMGPRTIVKKISTIMYFFSQFGRIYQGPDIILNQPQTRPKYADLFDRYHD